MLEEVLKKVKNLFRKDSGNHSLCKQRSEKQKNQFIIVGHGMVEMLAVLALVGVLSVGGVTWYQSSLRKAKSNDLWKEVMLRSIATRTAPDFMILKNGEEFNLAGLSNTTSNGYTIKSLKSNGASYYIELSNVPSATCKTMLKSVPEGVRHITVGDSTMYDGSDKSICDSESAMRFAVCFGVTCTSVDLCKNVDCGDNGWCNQAEGICYCNQGFVRDAANSSCIVDPCPPEMRCCNGGSKFVSGGACSCQCLWPWMGSDCTELDNVCMPTVSGHSSIDCGAHGQCIEDPSSDVPTKSPKCECDNCYSGNLCDQRDECCFQMMENPNLCSGHGDCFDVSDSGRLFLSCNCDSGYKNTKFYSKEYHTADALEMGVISCDTCDTGYYRSDENTCSACPTNEGVEGWSQEDKATTFNGSCVYQVHADCETVYLPQGAACVLGELNGVCSETHECVPDCGETAWWNGTNCSCLEGYYSAGGIIDNETHTCTACPENSFNEGTGNTSCTCAVGYFSADGTTNNETHMCTPCCPDDPESLEPNFEKCPPSTTEPGQMSCTCADKEWVSDSSSQYYNTCAIVCGTELCNEGQYCKDANTSHTERTPLECADLPPEKASIYVGGRLYTNFKPGFTSWWDADSICRAYGSSLATQAIIGHTGDAAQWVETDLYEKWEKEFLLKGNRTWLADDVSSILAQTVSISGSLQGFARARTDSIINEFICQKEYTPNCSENSTFDPASGSCLCDIGYYNAVDGTSDNGQICTECADDTFNYEKGSKFCCGEGEYIADTNESDYFPHPDHCATIPTSPDFSFMLNGYKMDIYATNKVPSWWDSNNLCKALGQTLMTAEAVKWTGSKASWQGVPESVILWNNISPYTSWTNYTFMQPERYGEGMYFYSKSNDLGMRNIGYTSKLKSPAGYDVVVVCQEPFSKTCPANATLTEEVIVDCQCNEGYYAQDGGRTMACTQCSSGTYNVGTGSTMCCTSGVEYMKDTNESDTIPHRTSCATMPAVKLAYQEGGTTYNYYGYKRNLNYSWWDAESICASAGGRLLSIAEYGSGDGSLADRMISYWESQGITWGGGNYGYYGTFHVWTSEYQYGGAANPYKTLVNLIDYKTSYSMKTNVGTMKGVLCAIP